MTVLFYTSIPRAFQTTLIGNLYEICQVYPTILLSEELNPETERILQKKELFPKLEKIVPVRAHTGEKNSPFFKNCYLYNLAKKIIKEYKPDVVVTASDMYPFEMYLMRFSKRIKALNIAIQPLNAVDSEAIGKWVDLTNSYLRFPSFLPLRLRFFLVKCRKYFGQFLYYWLLPVTVGEKPFLGKSSYILRKGNSGMRDADYQIVFSERDYNIFIKDGVPAEKLYILNHPLSRETKNFFEKAYLNKFKKVKEGKNIFCLMLPGEIELGFERSNFSLISREEREIKWVRIIKLISHIFPEWIICIKPHPDTRKIDKLKEKFELISENIKVADIQDSADKYIEMGDVIIGLPLSVSTVLFTASLQCPEKPIISLDFHQEILGDYYRDFKGIEYIDNEDKFINILKSIRDNKYQKEYKWFRGKTTAEKEFSNSIEMINKLHN
ncbi:MAG: hypothetical protein ABH813_02525 [Patescibacteria group bacterium]